MELAYVAYIILMWYAFKLLAFIWKFILQIVVPLFGYTHDLPKYGNGLLLLVVQMALVCSMPFN